MVACNNYTIYSSEVGGLGRTAGGTKADQSEARGLADSCCNRQLLGTAANHVANKDPNANGDGWRRREVVFHRFFCVTRGVGHEVARATPLLVCQLAESPVGPLR